MNDGDIVERILVLALVLAVLFIVFTALWSILA